MLQKLEVLLQTKNLHFLRTFLSREILVMGNFAFARTVAKKIGGNRIYEVIFKTNNEIRNKKEKHSGCRNW